MTQEHHRDTGRAARHRIDADADEDVDLFENALADPSARALMSLAGLPLSDVRGLLDDRDRLDTSLGASIVLATQGWASTHHIHVDEYAAVSKMLEEGASVDEIDRYLVERWNEPGRLESDMKMIRTLGAGDDDLAAIASQRLRLVRMALNHHRNEAYEASVLIALAQADGIVHDFGGRKGLYEGHKPNPKAEKRLIDERTIAGLDTGIATVQRWFSRPYKANLSAPDGDSGSRNAALHGRDLAYDTVTNSTKAFVLLVAAIEWAQPRARDEADRRNRERLARHAGDQGVDEFGRRNDRRGFSTARGALRELAICQNGHRIRNGQYASTTDEIDVPPKVQDDWPDVTLVVADDQSTYWAYTQSESGYWFGIAGLDGNLEWRFYEGTEPPDCGPLDDGDEWDYSETPNWSGDVY